MIIQPCDRRVFTNREYQEAGAIVKDDLSEAGLVLGLVSYFSSLSKYCPRCETTEDTNAYT